jgi:hypothetical protein
MKSLCRELWGRLGEGVLLALLAAFLLAPRPVLAGCNDHVRSNGPHPWRTPLVDALLRGDLGADVTPGRPAAPSCSGPSCSNNVPAPLSSGVQPDTKLHRGESLLAPLLVLSSSASRAFRPADEPMSPIFPTSGVFHPPRSIA